MVRKPNEDQVLRSLDNALYTLKRTIKTSGDVQDVVGLPEAFPVVIKHLLILFKILESIETFFKQQNRAEEEMDDEYMAVYQLAEMCRKRAEYLQDLFDSVKTTPNNPTPKMERYRKVVTDSADATIESVLKDLLEQAANLAAAPLVDDDLANELRESLEEVAALKPSLDQDTNKGSTALYNYSSGTQFYHGGPGNQNHCSGGTQITGNNSTNHMSTSSNPL
ncbi:hypothetical protein XA68_17988 [Ophiocordyceps unilateralis]|uniref:NACHT-NTPase and P-loop NTPases N-terminal domain-containing protein n=1 Tax=Ophiocordyceps unilateralis TaxID=268505 RepID=A0A2A9P2C9_OPHUN|nr:hypothetical protein XA68_17988 [Ophiocordyceps unilateralis]